jgi:hypothetical protein
MAMDLKQDAERKTNALIYAYAQTARNTQQHLCEGAGD